ncbi:MAG TPA: sugar ABC transporter permease [Desulfurococcaceae archaeon]|nr:sugar ABC transporter permease [Desulfurococcaceae archaeon]
MAKLPIPSSRKIVPWLFLTPLFIMIAFAWVGPLFLTVYLGFTDLQLKNFIAFIKDFFTPEVHLTLKNFEKIFFAEDPYITEVAKITVMYVGSVLAINAFFALILSIAIAYFVKNEFLSMFLRVSWLLPRITPGIIYALMWNWFVSPDGMLDTLLKLAGIPEQWLPSNWLLDKPYSQILMVIVNGYIGASFGMIVYTAAIKSIPPDLINAALVDGASEFQVAKNIIIPLLKWPIMFVTAWQTLSLMASYDVILMVWGAAQGASPSEVLGVAKVAGVTVWALYAYSQAFSQYQYGYAAAISLVLVVIGLVLIVFYFKIFGFRRLMEPSRVEV